MAQSQSIARTNCRVAATRRRPSAASPAGRVCAEPLRGRRSGHEPGRSRAPARGRVRQQPLPQRGAAGRARGPALAPDRRTGCGLRAAARRGRRRARRPARAADGEPAPEQAAAGAPDRARRPRRPLAARARDRGAEPVRRSRGRAGARADPARGRGARRDRPRRRRPAGRRIGPRGAGHGQARRRRAQLFERHRSDRPVRARAPRLPRPRGADGLRRAPDPRRSSTCSSTAPRTATSSAPISGCARIRPAIRWRSRSRTPSSTTSGTARTGSGRR